MSNYNLIRNIFYFILFVILIICLKKFKHKKSMYKIIAIILFFPLSFLFSLPWENLFISFNSVENVFYYIETGTIVNLIENNHSCLVLYLDNENLYKSCIIPKNDSKQYYIPHIWSISTKAEGFVAENYFYISNVTKTDDYYLNGSYYFSYEESIEITDNIDSDIFVYSEYNDTTGRYDHKYNAKIDGCNIDNYYLSINGKKYEPTK